MTCKGSWDVTALSPWEYVNEEVPSLVVTLWRQTNIKISQDLGHPIMWNEMLSAPENVAYL